MPKTPEGRFKAKVKKEIVSLFPGCYMHEMKCGDQGIPDTLVLYRQRWALLEFKESEKANKRPNQKYYVNLFNNMSFSRFVYPENEREVLHDLVLYFKGGIYGDT